MESSSEVSVDYMPSIYMRSELYTAASEGKFEGFQNKEEREILDLRTPKKNTILHIYITASKDDEPEFVKQVLTKFPGLLLKTNVKGESLLYMAARFGHKRIVEALIEHAKSHGNASDESPDEAVKRMLRIANKGKDTALHEAVRLGHAEVVEMLIGVDGDYLLNRVNKVGESPLYIAAERGRSALVSTILKKCPTAATIGPCGRTALHASTIAGDEDMTKEIVKKMKDLTIKGDSKKRIPLHYAAELGHHVIAKLLLEADKDLAYVQDTEGETALHLAAFKGNDTMMKEITLACRGCCEMVDNKGRNVLHVAVECNMEKAVELILDDPSLSNLLYQRNHGGNTPLHYCALSNSYGALKVLLAHPREDKMAFNNLNKNVHDILYTLPKKDERGQQFEPTALYLIENGIRPDVRIENDIEGAFSEKFWKESMDNILESMDQMRLNMEKYMEKGIIVAALIATVTFTASFTIPGGYISDQGSSLEGTPILAKKTAFKAFIVSNTLALLLSTLAIFCQILVRRDRVDSWTAQLSLPLTVVSLVPMIIAFITGTYVVLSHHHSLAIAMCTIGSSFFLFFAIMMLRNCFRE